MALNFKKKTKLQIFVGFYKPYLGLFSLDMACAFCIAAIDIFFPIITRYSLNNLLPTQSYFTFFVLMVGLVIAYVIRSLFQYIVTYWGHNLGVLMETDMRRDLFEHLQLLSFNFYDSNRTGRIMSHVTTDLFEITELAHHGPEDVFISIVTLIGAFSILFTINFQLSLILLLLIPLVLIFTISAHIHYFTKTQND